MGTWDTKLYGNDTTSDVRDTYLYLLEQQMSNEEAYQGTCEEYKNLFGTEEEALFWYALAHTQWSVGRLMPKVKDTALKFMQSEKSNGFEEQTSASALKWKSTLKQLKERLDSSMPAEKKFDRTGVDKRNPWNIGDIYAYQFHTKKATENGLCGKYILFQKIGDVEYYENVIFSVIQVFDYIFDFLPSLDMIKDIPILPLVCSPADDDSPSDVASYLPSFEWYMKATMLYAKMTDYPQKHLTFIGRQFFPEMFFSGNDHTDFFWHKNRMEDWLVEYYLSWKNFKHLRTDKDV